MTTQHGYEGPPRPCARCGLTITGTLYYRGGISPVGRHELVGPLCYSCAHPWCDRCQGLGTVLAAGGIAVVCPSCNGTLRPRPCPTDGTTSGNAGNSEVM